jgi:hypothetical protein
VRSNTDPQIEVRENETVDQLYGDITKRFAIAPDAFRLWQCDWSGRPERFLRKSDAQLAKLLGHTRIVFIENSKDDESAEVPDFPQQER